MQRYSPTMLAAIAAADCGWGLTMLWRALLISCMWLCLGQVQAQVAPIDPVGLATGEAQQLRGILTERVPDHASAAELQRHFDAKEAAAVRLSDAIEGERVTRQAVGRLPAIARNHNNLANFLDILGRHDEALQAWNAALRYETNPAATPLYMTNIAETLIKLGRLDEATQWLAKAKVTGLATANNSALGRSNQQRLLASTLRYQSQIEYARGHFDKAIELAAESIPYADRSLEAAQAIDPLPRAYRLESTINTYKNRFQILKNTGRLNDAQVAAAALIQLSRANSAPARLLPEFYSSLADLESAKRDFRQAEIFARKALDIWVALGYLPQHANRIEASANLLEALVYGSRLDEADALVRGLDEVATSNDQGKNAAQLAFARGLLHLKRERFAVAVPFLRIYVLASQRQYGASSYYAAQASGLLGVALWKQGEAASRVEAMQFLVRAVKDYMSAENAEFMLDIYERNLQREWIFSAYLEAVSQGDSASAAAAMAAADWVRSSTVQEALTDAATRAAASTPGIADLVREDSDARNEARALTTLLAARPNLGVALPEVEAKMRARIAELGTKRTALHARIKAQFSDYDQLVRPGPLVLSDVTRRLKPTQTLVMILPTERAVYVWALNSSGEPRFHRADMTLVRVAELVRQVRQTLDFNQMNGRLVPFAATAAFELYQALLMPLERTFGGKQELVVSAAGPLAQLPFSVLRTSAANGEMGNGAWLIQRYAISHVPSVSSFLAVSRFAESKSAVEPMLGWGDPVFDPRAREVAAVSPVRKIVLTRANTVVDVERGLAPVAINYGRIPRLPETRDELLSIARVMKADPVTDLRLGDGATRQSVLAASESGLLARKRVVAFATHGLMAMDLPGLDEPALALAAVESNSQNPLANLLTLKDVMGLRLNADWVVLSACNTAAADGKAEEALSGLARGFFYAGSRSVLVTHWAVDSESAKELTAATFEHYATDIRAPKSESLRQAILKVMGKPEFSHPAYWGPYALVGDGGR